MHPDMQGIILGYPYYQSKRLISRTQYWSAERHHALQADRLMRLLKYAIDKITFYRDHVGLSFSDEQQDPWAVLGRFPLIDKQIVNTNIKSLTHLAALRGLRATTGGSTGNPLVFYLDRYTTRQREKAFMFDQWGRVGYRFGDAIFNLRGRMPRSGQFMGHDRIFNVYYVSSIDLHADSVDRYIAAMNAVRPKFLHGYPSTIYQLARLIKQTRQKLTFSFQALLCGSEKLFSYQRKFLETVFGCRAYSWYGHSEYLILAGECEHAHDYHVYPQYGYTEFIPTGMKDENGQAIHEIVSTGFNNTVMPLIRYRTGDYAILADDKSCRCGRNYQLIKEVIGREQEFIVDNRESLISATSIFFGQHFEAFGGMDAIQVQQDRPGKIHILIVRNSNYQDNLFKEMDCRLKGLLRERMDIEYAFVQVLPKSPIGKARLVDQHLDMRQYLG